MPNKYGFESCNIFFIIIFTQVSNIIKSIQKFVVYMLINSFFFGQTQN